MCVLHYSSRRRDVRRGETRRCVCVLLKLLRVLGPPYGFSPGPAYDNSIYRYDIAHFLLVYSGKDRVSWQMHRPAFGGGARGDRCRLSALTLSPSRALRRRSLPEGMLMLRLVLGLRLDCGLATAAPCALSTNAQLHFRIRIQALQRSPQRFMAGSAIHGRPAGTRAGERFRLAGRCCGRGRAEGSSMPRSSSERHRAASRDVLV